MISSNDTSEPTKISVELHKLFTYFMFYLYLLVPTIFKMICFLEHLLIYVLLNYLWYSFIQNNNTLTFWVQLTAVKIYAGVGIIVGASLIKI